MKGFEFAKQFDTIEEKNDCSVHGRSKDRLQYGWYGI